ncbi:BF3164 family lipoprotein [Bacteroides sp.]|uniref:BF3164 family lipoprotein n=1 Tax=Bacteroides sp. TaxID=29523 RepID=UPI002FCBAF38
MIKQLPKVLSLLLYISILGACKEEKPRTVLELFPESQFLTQKKDFAINEDSLVQVAGLACDGKNLVVSDAHSGHSYTLFDAHSGEYIAPFGVIGQGPAEIPANSYGYLSSGCFTVFNDQTGVVMKYSLDSLRSGQPNASPVCLTRYTLPDAQISRLIAIDDSTFLGAGTYQPRYQYLLFDKNSNVMDCGVDVYNAADSTFNVYTKYLANQGVLIMHPQKKLFAYSVNFSSNIDFFTIKNNKIELIESLRLADPICEPQVGKIGDNTFYSVGRTENSQTGYIQLCGTTKYVYALYSDKKVNENGWKSDTVLVFDWAGHPVKKYTLDTTAYHLAVDEERQSLFAVVKNSDDGWSIVSYAL